jgi:hypothetical protein
MLLILEPSMASTYNSTCSFNLACSFEEQLTVIWWRISVDTEALLIRTDAVAAPAAPTKKIGGVRMDNRVAPRNADATNDLSIFFQ